jgi:hypothetical protein
LARGTSWSLRTTKLLIEPGRMVLHWSPAGYSCGGMHATRTEPERKEDSLDRGSNKAEREAAFQKLQSERTAKNLEEDRERDAEERQERKQIRQDEREEREQVRQEEREVRQEEREERKREREKARGQEESST